MKAKLIKVSASLLLTLTSLQLHAKTDDWQYLLDNNLSQWEVWMGIPHSSVKGLPDNTFTASNLNQHGTPTNALGLNNDPKNVVSVQQINGEPVLSITGEIYAGLTTLKQYENYHLSLLVKWGDKKWAPRLKAKKDSGLLFHCQGPHGAFWKVWKACHELQIQETDFGDYIPLSGPQADFKGELKNDKMTYQPNGKNLVPAKGYIHAAYEPDFENGKWNRVELFTLNDKAVFVVNDYVVMVIENSKDKDDNPLTQGQLQLQSEGAEVYYKDIKLRPINQWPEDIKRLANFAN
ncbi:3-keto-disaccharide hydrolase [Catenovulum adriaticum]|uniref:DUF1080 domain-containing protein n=1 Tax=Catenovulum adriaticum TaxID=2984846 RepID=A0ABY7AT43_9ALTE|nr:DUF1080 domain-containing protein [Catenovulum sp. TS8]WAJ72428.1 DUF1080 domain-containing protein [Catenovulum sp. TS8]